MSMRTKRLYEIMAVAPQIAKCISWAQSVIDRESQSKLRTDNKNTSRQTDAGQEFVKPGF
jgi:hypothetical protein